MRFVDEAEYPKWQALWRAVMAQMQSDLLIYSKAKHKLEAKEEAYHWFANCPQNVQMVCDYADLSYVDEMKKFKELKSLMESIPDGFSQYFGKLFAGFHKATNPQKKAQKLAFIAAEINKLKQNQPIIFAILPHAKLEQISFLPQLLVGFSPAELHAPKHKRKRIHYVQNLHQLELWGQHEQATYS